MLLHYSYTSEGNFYISIRYMITCSTVLELKKTPYGSNGHALRPCRSFVRRRTPLPQLSVASNR